LVLAPISIGAHVTICDKSFVTHGVTIAPGNRLGPFSSTSWAKPDLTTKPEPVKAPRTQNGLRVCVGLPLLMIMSILAEIPALQCEYWLFKALRTSHIGGTNGLYQNELRSAAAVWFAVPWLNAFIGPWSFFLMAVLVKWLIVGKFTAGPRPHTQWDDWRRWFMEMVIDHEEYHAALDPWVGTELLAIFQRCMGAKIGSRVQTDTFYTVEHDLITVGDGVTFGHGSIIRCSDDTEYLPTVLDRRSDILDNGVLQPGVWVQEHAVLGSCSLVNKNTVIKAGVIVTGSKNGNCVQLRSKKVTKLSPMEKEAYENFDSTSRYLSFNTAYALMVFLFQPTPQLNHYAGLILLYRVYLSVDDVVLPMFLFPLVSLFVMFANAFIAALLKWSAVGKFKEGDFPFYSWNHFKWGILLLLTGEFSEDFTDLSQGSVFYSIYLRFLGAQIGRNACVMDVICLETDLLHIEDHASVNEACDLSGHTVENLVVRMRPVKVCKGSNMQRFTIVMPGAVLEEGATLLHASQVLKGETVPAFSTWAGMPASPAPNKPKQMLHGTPHDNGLTEVMKKP